MVALASFMNYHTETNETPADAITVSNWMAPQTIIAGRTCELSHPTSQINIRCLYNRLTFTFYIVKE